MGKLIPNKLPQKNTVFTFAFNYGEPKTQTKESVAPDGNNKLMFTIGTGSAIQPNSIELQIPVSEYETSPPDKFRIVTLFDVPIDASTGNLVNSFGNIQGTINYSTGSVEVTPLLPTSRTITTYYSGLTYYTSS